MQAFFHLVLPDHLLTTWLFLPSWCAHTLWEVTKWTRQMPCAFFWSLFCSHSLGLCVCIVTGIIHFIKPLKNAKRKVAQKIALRKLSVKCVTVQPRGSHHGVYPEKPSREMLQLWNLMKTQSICTVTDIHCQSPGAGPLVGMENVYHCLQEHSSDIPESL